MNKIEAN